MSWFYLIGIQVGCSIIAAQKCDDASVYELESNAKEIFETVQCVVGMQTRELKLECQHHIHFNLKTAIFVFKMQMNWKS